MMSLLCCLTCGGTCSLLVVYTGCSAFISSWSYSSFSSTLSYPLTSSLSLLWVYWVYLLLLVMAVVYVTVVYRAYVTGRSALAVPVCYILLLFLCVHLLFLSLHTLWCLCRDTKEYFTFVSILNYNVLE